MTNSIADILGKRSYDEPEEIGIIQNFVRTEYKHEVQVTIQPKQILIHVKSAALAGTLRMRLHELRKICQTEKRLVIRIG